VIGLVCKLAEKYIYLKKIDKAHALLQHWKGQNIRMKQEEEKREKQLEEQYRLSAEAERAREEEKWANNISLHKLEYQVPKISVSTGAPQSTPPSDSDFTRKKRKEPETPLVKKEGNLETHFPPSRNLRFQPISQGKGVVATPLQIWEDIDANEVLLEDHLAMISFAQGHYEQALQQWLWVLDKKQKIYGSWKNVDIANTLEHLSVVSSRLQKPKHANQYLKKAFEILASTLGSDHKRTQQLHNDLAQRVEGEKLRAAAASRSEDF
jgi:hypothetical protein